MARPLCNTRLAAFSTLIALIGLTGCVYEDPRYGGYDYGGVGPNYDYPYYGNDYRYGRPYEYDPRRYG